ncbi:MAG: hypothetical protein R3F37_21130 [Candidatus Competibacteraceae bacterium]
MNTTRLQNDESDDGGPVISIPIPEVALWVFTRLLQSDGAMLTTWG